jgi:hypothetical protein
MGRTPDYEGECSLTPGLEAHTVRLHGLTREYTVSNASFKSYNVGMAYALALCFACVVAGLGFGTMLSGGYESVIDLLRTVVGGSLLLSLANAYYYRNSGSRKLRAARWTAVIIIPLFVDLVGITVINHFACSCGLFFDHGL